jgi:hypothetical protein
LASAMRRARAVDQSLTESKIGGDTLPLQSV